jgi:hypothetical protein
VSGFKPVAIMERSHNGRSYKISKFSENGKILVGLVSKENLDKLVRGERSSATIYQYVNVPNTEKATQNPLDFSIRLADPSKLESLQGDTET